MLYKSSTEFVEIVLVKWIPIINAKKPLYAVRRSEDISLIVVIACITGMKVYSSIIRRGLKSMWLFAGAYINV